MRQHKTRPITLRRLALKPACVLLLAMLSLALLPTWARADAEEHNAIRAVRFGTHPTYSRVVLDLQRQPLYRLVTTGADPSIISVEFPRIHRLPDEQTIRAHVPLIREVRFLRTPTQTIAEIQLQQPGRVLKHFRLEETPRIVIDIARRQAPSPLQQPTEQSQTFASSAANSRLQDGMTLREGPQDDTVTEPTLSDVGSSTRREERSEELVTVAQAVPGQPTGEDVQKKAEEARRARDEFLRRQKILLRQGELELELDTFYSMDTRKDFLRSDSNDQPAPITKNTTRTVTTALIARFVLVDNLELSVAVPFVYAKQESELGTNVGILRDEVDGRGLGDVAARLRYQLWREQGAFPDVILDLNGKSLTGDDDLLGTVHWGDDDLLGTGHWNVGGGITLVKTLDPVVFFGRVGYEYTLERDGRDPGNEISYSIGMGFSLNDVVSFNMQLLGAYVEDFERDGKKINDSSLEILSLQFSVTVLVTKRLFIEPAVNFGLTDDAVDVVAGVSIPFKF